MRAHDQIENTHRKGYGVRVRIRGVRVRIRVSVRVWVVRVRAIRVIMVRLGLGFRCLGLGVWVQAVGLNLGFIIDTIIHDTIIHEQQADTRHKTQERQTVKIISCQYFYYLYFTL